MYSVLNGMHLFAIIKYKSNSKLWFLIDEFKKLTNSFNCSYCSFLSIQIIIPVISLLNHFYINKELFSHCLIIIP